MVESELPSVPGAEAGPVIESVAEVEIEAGLEVEVGPEAGAGLEVAVEPGDVVVAEVVSVVAVAEE